jgi:sterol desaturase/sphingolipid hydroxylase (fatty acid hydroxylase superfamily)
LVRLLLSAGQSLWLATQVLFLSAVLFGSLAILLKGDEAFAAARRAAAELRVNFSLFVVDALLVAPVLAVLVEVIRRIVTWQGLMIVKPEHWGDAPVFGALPSLGTVGTLVAVAFIGDFGSYWRHRLEHTRWLWPAHAVHHSDTEMTWLTLQRFHPINRLTTSAIDITFLAVLGFPAWALVANEMLRHYYGEFIHADLPWTYGPLKVLFVSPAMHRWHHARDVVGSGSNFATVFSVFDRAFGTYYVPGPCNVPLGVTDDMGQGTIRQLLYPFVAWTGELRRGWRASRRAIDGSKP